MVQEAEMQGVHVNPQSFWFGENPGNITKKMIWKIRPAWKKRSRLFFLFLEVIFFGVFFGQVSGNLCKHPSHLQKFACSYAYVWTTP